MGMSMTYVFELHFTTGSGQCNRSYMSPALKNDYYLLHSKDFFL